MELFTPLTEFLAQRFWWIVGFIIFLVLGEIIRKMVFSVNRQEKLNKKIKELEQEHGDLKKKMAALAQTNIFTGLKKK
ncbi:MAG: hypothetical protein WC529_08090 [Candidatus Margulisiibacteriota bacterium]